MSGPGFVRLQLAPTDRTDLVCVSCGHFRTDLAIVRPGGSDRDAEAGLHSRCRAEIHAPARGAEAVTGSAA